MRRIRRIAVAGVIGAALLMSAAPAHAQVVETPKGSIEMDVLDVWDITGDTITAVAGPRSCTVTASTPTNSANQVAGSGSVSCNKRYAKMTLTVCIQAKQPFVSEQTSWEDVDCNPTKAQLNTTGLNDTATAPCLPGPMLYRTKVTAEGFNADSSDPAFVGIIHSGSALYDCFL